MTTEFTHPLPVTRIGPGGLDVRVEASPMQCKALAGRMDIPAVLSFRCAFSLRRDGDIVFATGALRAKVTRVCIVSAEDFDTQVRDRFTVRFVPPSQLREDPDPDDDDEIPYEGGTIDLAEAAAEQLALALDPYPRMEGAVLPEIADDTSPFAVLARLAGKEKP